MNRCIFLMLSLGLISAQIAFAQKHGKISVYLIGGQSNATGQGYMANMADTMKFDTTILLFHSGKPHLNSGKPALTWMPLRQASESADRFGPELGFSNKIRLYDHNKHIAIIKHAHSGTNLYNQWNPGKDAADTAHWGQQFKVFVQTIDSGLNALRKMGYMPVIKGMLWQQGENDAIKIDSASLNYAKNLSHFISRVRQQYKTPKMPFVYGYVLPPPNTGADRDLVRKAEHDVDQHSATPWAIKNAIVVFTDDLSLRANDKNTKYPKDIIHFGTNGTWVLGIRMAQKFAN
ncbi:sialate O-acetylesterase [Mucilaginibacter sp. HMF5004]|uniref:sialate O-acetylesterase n=1 Tax=Mucilaginibacter rivuli TaxID=2857527 RepID=UPI001C5DA1D7|nr:sialate O-acetylesterase [Mucilaginibacter rivuli]MBW4891537.1 sialate O-acetylesterase [Mucilaginibacter rivuli]